MYLKVNECCEGNCQGFLVESLIELCTVAAAILKWPFKPFCIIFLHIWLDYVTCNLHICAGVSG